MNKEYDIIIVGMGPSAIFCAYELIKLGTKKSILLIEKGKQIEKRKCYIDQYNKCIKCKPYCNIISGFSGAGAFSDGKLVAYHLSSYNKNTDNLYIGGKEEDSYIKKYLKSKEIKDLMQYTDNIYLEFGADKELIGLNNIDEVKKIQNLAQKQGLSLVDTPIRHLGTEKSHEIYKKLQDYLKDKVDMIFSTNVEDLIIENGSTKGVITKNTKIYAKKTILALGASGALWLEEKCSEYEISSRNGYLDIGIRYELSNKTMNNINELMYEGKFIGKLAPYYDKVRTFCQCPSGFVTSEVYDNGCMLVNGHSYKDTKSENTNLAIVVSHKFPPPLKSSTEYGLNMAKKASLLTGGNVIIQRFGDVLNGTKTTQDKLLNNAVKPTLSSAFPGDITYILDYRTMLGIINFIKQVDKVVPGFAHEDNLLYGPEIKLYGNEVEVNENFETSLKNLYSIGAGGGMTTGLMMASCSGIQMARILEKGAE